MRAKWVAALGVALLAACSASPDPPARSADWSKAAPSSVAQASKIVGGMDDHAQNVYRRALLHVANAHQRPSQFTIAQMVDQQERREAAVRVERNHVAESQAIERARVAERAKGIDAQEACKAYSGAIGAMRGLASFVVSLRCQGSRGGPHHAYVTVRYRLWSAMNYDERIRYSKMMWQSYVMASKMTAAPDTVHLTLLGEGEEKLAESDWMAGSIVRVIDK